MSVSCTPWTADGYPVHTSCRNRFAQLFRHTRPDHLMLMMPAPRGQHHEHRQLPLFRPAGATCCMMHAWRPASPIREHYASSAVVLCLRLRCLCLLGSQPSNKSPLRVHTIDATAWELGSML